MTLADWSPADFANVGSAAIMAVCLVWLLTRGGPMMQSMWLKYLRERDEAHAKEREEDRKVRHEHASALNAVAMAVHSLNQWLKDRRP